jgi:hypothetical protein
MAAQDEKIAPPVIVIGMHRSGTTLLTRMLGACGVFWGALPDENNECAFFQSMNEALFSRASATWDVPAPMESYFSQPDHQKQAADFLERRVKESLYIEYCRGLDTDAPGQNHQLSGSWGWKDPRNVYTLGLWLNQFPNARVIHIIRSGIDAAMNLWQRETARPEGRDHPHYSLLCQTLEGCFGLWKSYVHKARHWTGSVEHFLEIRFEALITTPRPTLERLAQFLGLTLDRRAAAAEALIRPNPPLVRSDDRQLDAFIQRALDDPLMISLGYPYLP